MRTALYVRVSTQEQAEEGYSIAEQTDRLKKYCEARGWTVIQTYVDPGYSGSNMERPGLKRLIDDINLSQIEMVLVYKLDRLSRSQKDTLYLIEDVFLKNNAAFVSMNENFDTSTPFGRAMIGILSVFAQLEREQIKERMAMGHAGRAKDGYWRGGSNPPIGYDFIDGKLIVNEYEAMQIKELFDLFLKGETMHGICKILSNKYTNRYSSWNNHATIGKILRNTMYIGKITYNGIEYDGKHEAIISSEVFMSAQQRYNEISDKMDDHRKSPYKGKNLLSGLIFCGNCGARYFTCSCVNKRFGTYYYYKCYSRDGNKEMKKIDGCKNPTYKMEDLDKIVIEEILNLSVNKLELERISKRKIIAPDNKLSIIQARISDIDKQISKLMDLYQFGSIPINDIGNRLEKLQSEKSSLQNDIDRLSISRPILSIDDAYSAIQNADKVFASNDMSKKRVLINTLIKKIILTNEDIDIEWKFS